MRIIWLADDSHVHYRGLKLTEQAMKILERIVDGLIRQVVSIDDSQFGFVPGRGTTDAIFVVRQLQEKYLAVNKRLYMPFVDLEKAFDRVPRKVIWWALRKLGVEKWIVWLVQRMYANARSLVRVGEGFSKEFEVKVWSPPGVRTQWGAGRPKQTWKKLTERNCREWKLTTVDPQERSTSRSGVQPALHAASQLPGKGPTDVDDAPAPARQSKIRL